MNQVTGDKKDKNSASTRTPRGALASIFLNSDAPQLTAFLSSQAFQGGVILHGKLSLTL